LWEFEEWGSSDLLGEEFRITWNTLRFALIAEINIYTILSVKIWEPKTFLIFLDPVKVILVFPSSELNNT